MNAGRRCIVLASVVLLAIAIAFRALFLFTGDPFRPPGLPDWLVCALALAAWWRASRAGGHEQASVRQLVQTRLTHIAAALAAAVGALSFLGIGFLFDWLYFTGGALKFDTAMGTRLIVAFVLLTITATLGAELLLRGILLRDWLRRARAPVLALILAAAATASLEAPIAFAAELSSALTTWRIVTFAAWGFSLSVLYAATRSVVACGVADAFYRWISLYLACDVELACQPVGYFSTSLGRVYWLAAATALVPGLVGIAWMRLRHATPSPD